MESINFYKSKDGKSFNSKDRCLEYEKYLDFFGSYLVEVLPHKDKLFTYYDYYLNEDLTVQKYSTRTDPMEGRPPLRNSSNIGHISELIIEYKSEIQNLIDDELKYLEEKRNKINKVKELIKQ